MGSNTDGALVLGIRVDDSQTIPAAMKQASDAVAEHTDKVKRSFQEAGSKSSGAGRDINHSMVEARHAVQGLGEEIGIRVPKFVQTFLEKIPGVQPALSAAFSTIAVIGFIQVIAEIPDALEKGINALRGWNDEARKTFKEQTEAAADTTKHLRELQAARLSALTVGTDHQTKLNLEIKNNTDLTKDAAMRSAKLTQEAGELSIQIDELKNSYVGFGKIGSGKEIEQMEVRLESLKAQAKEANDEAFAGAAKAAELNATKAADAKRLQLDNNAAIIEGDQKLEAARLQIVEQGITNRAGQLKLAPQEEARQLSKLEDEKYSLAVRGVDRRLALLKSDPSQTPAAVSKLNSEKAALEQQHLLNLENIKDAATAKDDTRRQKNADADRKLEMDMTGVSAEASQQQFEQTQLLLEDKLKHNEIGLSTWKNQQKEALDKWHEMQTSALQDEYSLESDDLAAQERTINKKLELDRQYANGLRQIQHTSFVNSEMFLDEIDKSFGQHIFNWISEQETFKHAMAQAWNQVATVAITNMIRMAEQAAIAAALHKSIAAKQVFIEAKGAAASAYHHVMMALPFPADVIVAPIVAAGTFAAVMSLAAFEQGGIVPSTDVALLHKNEMVLPADLSQGFQNMLGQGGGGAGHTFHMPISVHGAMSPKQARGTGEAIAKEVKRAIRYGNLSRGDLR